MCFRISAAGHGINVHLRGAAIVIVIDTAFSRMFSEHVRVRSMQKPKEFQSKSKHGTAEAAALFQGLDVFVERTAQF